MRLLDLPQACILLLSSCLAQHALATSPANPSTHRVLHAATKRADLYRRSMRISKKFSTELSYIEDENGWNGRSTFASQVRVSSEKPLLNLEEIEHHLQDVQCDEGRITLDFVDKSSARDAFHACHNDRGGLIITSHDSCNGHGERNVYKVDDVAFMKDGESLELFVTQSLWQEAFDRVDISFGHTNEDHLFRRHSDFAKAHGKRQSVPIPKNATDGTNGAIFNLESSFIGTTFSAESFLAGLEQLVPIPQLPIEVGCNNCTTTGKLTLTQGAFNIDVSQIDLIPDIFQGGDDGKEISNVITGGFFELAASNVGARLDLFARPKASGAFEIALFSVPVLGFVVPGIGQAGAVFEPKIAVDFDISGGFELNYGIEVAIPNDSKIRLELGDLRKSAVTGFPGSTLKPLPFIANATAVDIKLGLAFVPTIPIGFEFVGKLTAEASVSMNLPRLDARLSTKAPPECGNSTNTTIPTTPYGNNTISKPGNSIAIGPLTLIEANVSVTVDTGFSVNFPLLPPPLGNVSVGANLFSTNIPLVTACAAIGDAFDDNGKGIVPAPPSATYGNVTTPIARPTPIQTPCETPSWNQTITETKTVTTHMVMTTLGVHLSSSAPHESQGYGKEPIIPVPTWASAPPPQQIHASSQAVVRTVSSVAIEVPSPSAPPPQEAPASTKLAHSISSVAIVIPSPSALPVFNSTATPTSAQVVVTPPVAPPAQSIVMSTGIIVPSNTSIGVGQQTSVPVFTGAATLGVGIPSLDLLKLDWPVVMVFGSVVLGALVL